jgi:hypothetical protein
MTNTPVSSIDSDPLRFGTYQFPKDVFENGQLGHYMVFYVNVLDRTKYVYPGGSATKQVAGPMKYLDDTGLQSEIDRVQMKNNKITGNNLSSDEKNLSISSRNRRALQGVGAFKKTTKRITDSVALYLPANVVDTTAATYEDTPTGMLGMIASDMLRFGTAFGGKDFEAAAAITGEAGAQFAQEAFKRMGAALVEGLTGGENAMGLANKIFGRADNPFIEVLFSTMDVRKFIYNFNFAPRNEAETAEIQQIIQLFRFHMAPELQGVNSRYLTLPSEFDIHYMYKAQDGQAYENDYFNRIATCVLESVNTNYTPGDKVRTFESGAPTQITMSLAFRETEILTKEKINAGY